MLDTQGIDGAPLVSVVIPAYNAAASLRETVASAQCQSLTEIEIVIVDDGSTDDTLALARRLAAADPRLQVIAAGKNRGPAGARNLGFAAAHGRWIALLDSDDVFEPGRLACLVAAARDCGADLLADNLLLEQEDGSVAPMLATDAGAERVQIGAAAFLLGNMPDPLQPRKSYGFLKPIFRRDFLVQKGLRYDEGLRFAEDLTFHLECLGAGGRFFLLRRPLYRYRLRGDSLTARHSIEDLRRLQAVNRRLLGVPGLRDSAGFAAAMRRFARSTDQRLQWRLVIDAVKRRDGRGALRAGLKGPHVFTYVCGQLAAEAWRRLCAGRARAWARGRAKAAET